MSAALVVFPSAWFMQTTPLRLVVPSTCAKQQPRRRSNWIGAGDRSQLRRVPDAPIPLHDDTGGGPDPSNSHQGSTACPARVRDMLEFCWDDETETSDSLDKWKE